MWTATRVLDIRVTSKHKHQCLVEWHPQHKNEPTWEPWTVLVKCEGLLESFYSKIEAEMRRIDNERQEGYTNLLGRLEWKRYLMMQVAELMNRRKLGLYY